MVERRSPSRIHTPTRDCVSRSSGRPLVDIRQAAAADAALITRQRTRMFLEAGFDPDAVAAAAAACEAWLQRTLTAGTYVGFIAEAAGRPIGGIGVMVHQWPPHPHHPDEARRGYLLNLYVDPEHRGGGLGAALLDRAQDWLRNDGLAFASLHPTQQALPLYRRFGWSESGELVRKL